jgi:hypothetical protein
MIAHRVSNRYRQRYYVGNQFVPFKKTEMKIVETEKVKICFCKVLLRHD